MTNREPSLRGTADRVIRGTGPLWCRLLLSCAGILLGAALVEVVLRVGIHRGAPAFCQPALYADPFAEDLYWQLHILWNQEGRALSRRYANASLGWAPATTKRNPLGIITEHRNYAPQLDGPTVLCFGDSFMAGSEELPVGDRLPQQLEPLLQERTVYNYGVSGYGVDQICLRFEEVFPQFSDPFIVIGILMEDLDRSVLTIRGGPKPYFTIEDEALVHHPPDRDGSLPLTPNEVHVGSYLAHFLARQIAPTQGKATSRVEEKVAVNRKILQRIGATAHKHRLPMIFVLFYDEPELWHETWREPFLKGELDQLGVPYVDTKQILLDAMESEPVEAGQLYLTSDGHMNERGYALIAPYLAAEIRRIGAKLPTSGG